MVRLHMTRICRACSLSWRSDAIPRHPFSTKAEKIEVSQLALWQYLYQCWPPFWPRESTYNNAKGDNMTHYILRTAGERPVHVWYCRTCLDSDVDVCITNAPLVRLSYYYWNWMYSIHRSCYMITLFSVWYVTQYTEKTQNSKEVAHPAYRGRQCESCRHPWRPSEDRTLIFQVVPWIWFNTWIRLSLHMLLLSYNKWGSPVLSHQQMSLTISSINTYSLTPP